MSALLPIVVIFALIWLFMIRPQMRRQRATRELQSQLTVGDRVMLTSGIYAEVNDIGDDSVLVQLADDVVVRVARAAVLRVLTREELIKAGLEVDDLLDGEEATAPSYEPLTEDGADVTPATDDEPDAPAEETN